MASIPPTYADLFKPFTGITNAPCLQTTHLFHLQHNSKDGSRAMNTAVKMGQDGAIHSEAGAVLDVPVADGMHLQLRPTVKGKGPAGEMRVSAGVGTGSLSVALRDLTAKAGTSQEVQVAFTQAGVKVQGKAGWQTVEAEGEYKAPLWKVAGKVNGGEWKVQSSEACGVVVVPSKRLKFGGLVTTKEGMACDKLQMGGVLEHPDGHAVGIDVGREGRGNIFLKVVPTDYLRLAMRTTFTSSTPPSIVGAGVLKVDETTTLHASVTTDPSSDTYLGHATVAATREWTKRLVTSVAASMPVVQSQSITLSGRVELRD